MMMTMMMINLRVVYIRACMDASLLACLRVCYNIKEHILSVEAEIGFSSYSAKLHYRKVFSIVITFLLAHIQLALLRFLSRIFIAVLLIFVPSV
jgi:hypothetical protein